MIATRLPIKIAPARRRYVGEDTATDQNTIGWLTPLAIGWRLHRRHRRARHLEWNAEDGIEIRLFDPRRKPRDWTALLRPTDCAVFLKDRITSASVGPDGRPYSEPDDTTCILFDSLDKAQQYCEAKVEALPHLRCEVYDS